MPYTFWYSGILIGESEFEADDDRRRHHTGVFHPTAYGLEIFPRLTGILSAGRDLEQYLESNGLCADDMSKEEVEQVFETTPAGQKIVDIGRSLCEVEVRAPDGRRLEFASIGFIDTSEVRALTRELELDSDDDRSDRSDRSELPPDTPRYIVSATLTESQPEPADRRLFGRLRRRRARDEN